MSDALMMPPLPATTIPQVRKSTVTEGELAQKSQQFAALLWEQMVKPMWENAGTEGDNEMSSFLMIQMMSQHLAATNDLGVGVYLSKTMTVIPDAPAMEA